MDNYWKTVDGWFDFQNLYGNMVTRFQSGAHFVEVGSWKGKSSAYMAEKIRDSGKSIQFDCVDTFKGTDNEAHHGEDPDVQNGNLFDVFTTNMAPLADYYNVHCMTSEQASKLYQDGSLDFVYIDADHSYSAVKLDIEVWFPKIRPGGIIAGHDYKAVGVKTAVREKFLNKFTRDGSSWIYQKVQGKMLV